MLENRDYMRQPRYRPRWSATSVLLVVNIVLFICKIASRNPLLVDNYFALSIEGLKHGYVWQLLTFQFLHSGWVHLLLNCWALFVFGREVENILGLRRYLTLYFSGGIAGGLLHVALALLWPARFGSAVAGASAGILGIVAAFAMLFPERDLTMLLFFIIPVNLRAKYLLWISTAVAVLGIAFPNSQALGADVAHAAHLGGILTGVIFIRYPNVLAPFAWLPRWFRWRRSGSQIRQPRDLSGLKSARSADALSDNPSEEFISRQVDPILDKISAHGIQSLTERERKILEAARNRMAKK
jgi:membrane associated rhomboid family serine protease